MGSTFSFGFNMIALARSWRVYRRTFREEALLPHAGNLIGLPRRHRRTDPRASRKFDCQKTQHCTDRRLIILAELFIFHLKRFDSDPSEEIIPQFVLAFGFMQ